MIMAMCFGSLVLSIFWIKDLVELVEFVELVESGELVELGRIEIILKFLLF